MENSFSKADQITQTLLMLEAIRRADVLQMQASLPGGARKTRRQAVSEALNDLTEDMAICLDVMQQARDG